MFCGYECCPNKLASSSLHRWHLGFVLEGNFMLFCLFTFLSLFFCVDFPKKKPHIPVCIICLFSSNFGLICMFFPWVCLHFSIFPWIFLFFFHAPSRGKGHKWWTVAWTKKEQTKHRWCFSLFVFGFLLTYLFEWFWICLVCFGFCSSCFSGGCVFFPVFPLFLHSLDAL